MRRKIRRQVQVPSDVEVAAHRLRLEGSAKNAFAHLCQFGCKPAILAGKFEWLEREIPLAGRTISLHPLDSWETSFGGLKRRDIKQITGRAKKLCEDVLRLQNTPVIGYLTVTGKIERNDLLYSPASPIPHRGHPAFRTVLALPQIARQVGYRRRPDVSRYLLNVYRYIRDRTGGPCDSEVSAILIQRFPLLDLPADPEGMKKWRRKHGA